MNSSPTALSELMQELAAEDAVVAFDVDETMLYQRARCYDPTVDRWMSQDPLGFDAGDINIYRYPVQQQP